nr:penicillin acylase family protein [Streptomyces fructofermentans]
MPHITGTTRRGTERGAGHAAARDRSRPMDGLRHVGRGGPAPFEGVSGSGPPPAPPGPAPGGRRRDAPPQGGRPPSPRRTRRR